MKRLFGFLLKELREMLVPLLFFLLVFHLIAITKSLLLESYGLTPTTVAIATVGALIAAKAVLIGNALPFIDRLSHKPLLYPVLWKTAIFWLFFLLLRGLEEWIHLWIRNGNAAEAFRQLSEEISWPLFAAIQIWLLFALLLYSAIVELDRHLGEGTVKRAFLGGTAQRNESDRTVSAST